MRGTGSLDFSVEDTFVAETASFSPIADAPHCDGPLYRLPFGLILELSVVAVAIGIARRLLADFAALTTEKRFIGTTHPLAQDPLVLQAYAASRARLEMACDSFRARVLAMWNDVVAGDQPSAAKLALLRAIGVEIVSNLRRDVEDLSALAGMPSIDNRQPITRRRRDIATIASHFVVSPLRLAECGAELLSDVRQPISCPQPSSAIAAR